MIDMDVLIIGAGPTGLMMACQLLRFGVSFRIIDKQKDRALESRAFAIQAKSMEIFPLHRTKMTISRHGEVGTSFVMVLLHPPFISSGQMVI